MKKKKSPWLPMHPLRKCLVCIGLPLYLLMALGGGAAATLVDVFTLGNVDSPGWLTWIGIAWFLLCSAVILILSGGVAKIELKAELDKYAYLCEEPTPLGDEIVIPDGIEEAYCAFTKDGLSLRIDEKCDGQVFDELPENVFFVPWERAECFLVTQNVNRRVHIGLAIVLPDTGEDEGEEDIFVVSMQEKVYAAMHAFGLMEKVALDFAYLRYNPKDAIKQILQHGRVVKLRNKETGKKLKNEEEMFRW